MYQILLSLEYGRASLVVHWLKFSTPNAGGPGSIPGQGTRFQMLQLRPGTTKLFKNKELFLKIYILF